MQVKNVQSTRQPYVIGLTGGIGSGKSTVAEGFAALGVPVVDADAIAHALTAPGGGAVEPIRHHFGAGFVGPSGAMDRDRMRDLVFKRPAARAELEAILHPLIRIETSRQLGEVRALYCILMIPLLVEAAARDPEHWRDRYDRILVADCSESTQVARVMARNGFDEEAVRRIMAVQATREQRLAHADDVIDNDGGLAALGPQVERLHHEYLAAAAGGNG
jgi:dephospho-CoA kinase